MQQFEIDYKNYLKVQTPSDAALSTNRVLTHMPDVNIPAEINYFDQWKLLPEQGKEDSENEIFNSLFNEIPESEHLIWEDAFGVLVLFTLAPNESEYLSDKCKRKKSPH